jgi:hypothetical protein
MVDSTNIKGRRRKIYMLLFIIISLLILVIIVGMLGFRYIVKLNWIDSFHNAAMYTSGMGAIATMEGTEEKIFASIYALIAGLLFVTVAAYIVTQIIAIEFVNYFDVFE